jgi:serine/threonine protein kinase
MPDISTAPSSDDIRGRSLAKNLLGRFELVRVLGKGAQSTVWLAFDPRLERQVALKVMKSGMGADGQAVAQWLQEARSVSRLTHPNIIPVYEADIHETQPYLVFEYIAGATLDQHIKQNGALPASQAVAFTTFSHSPPRTG